MTMDSFTNCGAASFKLPDCGQLSTMAYTVVSVALLPLFVYLSTESFVMCWNMVVEMM
jgi:hypothetical protein